MNDANVGFMVNVQRFCDSMMSTPKRINNISAYMDDILNTNSIECVIFSID